MACVEKAIDTLVGMSGEAWFWVASTRPLAEGGLCRVVLHRFFLSAFLV